MICRELNCLSIPQLAHTNGNTDWFHTRYQPSSQFSMWEPVYFKLDDASFPSDSREQRGRFVGISEHVGHAMTYMILTNDTQKIIHQSNVQTALDPLSPNKQVDPPSHQVGRMISPLPS
jgi:hypothetical protein